LKILPFSGKDKNCIKCQANQDDIGECCRQPIIKDILIQVIEGYEQVLKFVGGDGIGILEQGYQALSIDKTVPDVKNDQWRNTDNKENKSNEEIDDFFADRFFYCE